jgi:hypothetical protein
MWKTLVKNFRENGTFSQKPSREQQNKQNKTKQILSEKFQKRENFCETKFSEK